MRLRPFKRGTHCLPCALACQTNQVMAWLDERKEQDFVKLTPRQLQYGFDYFHKDEWQHITSAITVSFFADPASSARAVHQMVSYGVALRVSFLAPSAAKDRGKNNFGR